MNLLKIVMSVQSVFLFIMLEESIVVNINKIQNAVIYARDIVNIHGMIDS